MEGSTSGAGGSAPAEDDGPRPPEYSSSNDSPADRFDEAEIADRDVLDLLDPAVQEWWVDEFGEYVDQNGGFFTPPQREAIPLVHEGSNALVAAPTGSGKTLAAFTAILNELFALERADQLENAVYCVYVSPLKSLANDIHRNLEVPLDGIREHAAARRGSEESADDEIGEIRHAIRHGDTSDYERQKMLEETPHILNTTPETLAILLNSPKFREKLRNVEYVVVDEIHALADSKRGTHLSVSLERLHRLAGGFTRVGCSATVEPLDEMGRFLVGQETTESETAGTDPSETAPRDVELVDARYSREYDLELRTPVGDLVNAPRNEVQEAFYRQLNDLVGDHGTSIVFTNSRSGAERVLDNLRERGLAEDRSACHHGSLSKERRQEVEQGLKNGELDVVTTSTSLELGVDMPDVDLVVQVGSAKSVAALLQRVGRAGHRVGKTVTGRVFALDRDELVECAVMLRKARDGFVDRVHVPEGAHDVAAQHVFGMAIEGPLPESEIRSVLTSAYPYRNYGDDDWERLMRYLTADYDGLEDRNVYAKIWRDQNDPEGGEHHYPDYEPGTTLIGKRGYLARVILLQNLGTIPDSFSCNVVVRGDDEWVGQLDESYLDTLEQGDVFVLGGDSFAYQYRRGSKVHVDRTAERATVPSWYSERLPLSFDLGMEIARFQREAVERYESGGSSALRRWLTDFPICSDSVRALARLFDEQLRYGGPESVATDERLVVEEVPDQDEYRRRYYVHATYGRRFNDGLARVLAHRCTEAANTNVQIAVADNGFVLSMPLNRKVDIPRLLGDLDADAIRGMLRDALHETDLLKRYFRIDATRSLMILKHYKGYEKSASKQQVASEMLLGFAESLDDFAVLEETYREVIEDRLDVAGIQQIIEGVQHGDVEVSHVRNSSPSPRAFGLATLSASDTVLAEDEDAVLRDFHRRVHEELEAGNPE